MKNIFLALIIFVFLACGSSDDPNNSPLPNITVNETIFLNIQTSLQVVGGSATIPGGISGILVYRLNNAQFLAWDRACPHLPPQQCSPMTFDGLLMTCTCDDTNFSILDGSPQSGTEFAAKQYRVVRNGESLIITNF